MPTIRIQALQNQDQNISELLTACTQAAAEALDIPQDWIWAVFQPVLVGDYVEGGMVWSSDDINKAPVLISITALEGRSAELKAAMLSAVSHSTAEQLRVPINNVFAEYRDIPKGHAFSAGSIV